MGTAIIPPGNPTPILDPPEHDLDFVPPAGEGFVVAASCRSVLVRRNAWCDALLLECRDEPIRIIAAVSEQVFGVGKTGQQASRTSVIAGGPCGQQQMHRLASVVAHGVQLRVQAIVRAANTAGDSPFLSRLAAVRWAFRWVDRSSGSLWCRVVTPTRGRSYGRSPLDSSAQTDCSAFYMAHTRSGHPSIEGRTG